MNDKSTLTRRAMLLGGTALGAVCAVAGLLDFPSALAADGDNEPFTPDVVRKLAEETAQRDFARPAVEANEFFNQLDADKYRDIRFRPETAIWRGQSPGAEVQLLPRGWIFDTPVSIRIVENGQARRLKADGTYFSFGPLIEQAPEGAPFAFSGFRLASALERSDQIEPFAVFQGASYFRARGSGQVFGLSARGLAVDTAQPQGEEFPIFRAFWIEKPTHSGGDTIVHALLDSKSVAGAYRFIIHPGATTVFDVSATLFPRRKLSHVGIAPLTSMYLNGSQQKRVATDWRPSVHNSEGLAILNGNGERLWRPLINPRTLQTSAFVDKSPRGFGLVQRNRSVDRFEDLASKFERRPSLWVEPGSDWGDGVVELVEIPSEEEIHDNVVAYWRPAAGIESGVPFELSYRLSWGKDTPLPDVPARVEKTLVAERKKDGVVAFAIDFAGPGTAEFSELPQADVSTNTGSVANVVIQRHLPINGLRVTFDLKPNGTPVVELRCQLRSGGTARSEIWIYRWTN